MYPDVIGFRAGFEPGRIEEVFDNRTSSREIPADRHMRGRRRKTVMTSLREFRHPPSCVRTASEATSRRRRGASSSPSCPVPASAVPRRYSTGQPAPWKCGRRRRAIRIGLGGCSCAPYTSISYYLYSKPPPCSWSAFLPWRRRRSDAEDVAIECVQPSFPGIGERGFFASRCDCGIGYRKEEGERNWNGPNGRGTKGRSFPSPGSSGEPHAN